MKLFFYTDTFLLLPSSHSVKHKSRFAETDFGYVHTVQLTSPVTNLTAAEFTR